MSTRQETPEERQYRDALAAYRERPWSLAAVDRYRLALRRLAEAIRT
ncbi:MAG: hypothetical protein ACLGIN_14725 [Candidatus Sericytochromatia bacterium]